MKPRNAWDRTLERHLGRRRFIKGLGLAAAGLALAPTIGCQESTTVTTPAAGGSVGALTPSAGGQPTPTPVKGGTLNVAQASDLAPKTAVFTISPTNAFVTATVYEKLMHYKSDKFEPELELAESLTFAPDYKSLTIRLRSGVKFHTGRALTADDVKWNLQMLADPANGSQLLNFAKWVQKIETPDPLTLVLYFDQARPSFLDTLEYMLTADKETYEDTLNGKTFVGTGPFKFKEWVPGDHFTLVRNPDYWQKGRPYLDEITVRVLPEQQTQLINLQTGATDVAMNVDPRDAKDMEKDAKYRVVVAPVFTTLWYVGCDVKAPPFTDKRVRQAIAYLIDRKRIVDTLLFYGVPTVLPWHETSPAYTPELANAYAYNPAKAKELLQQAGVTGEVSFPYTVSAAYVPTHGIAELVQGEMAKLGLKASIERLQHPDFLTKLNGAKFGGIWSSGVGFMHLEPSTLFVMSFPYRVPNSSGYDTPEYRQLIDQMLNTTDAAAKKQVYKKMNELLLDECFMIPINGVQTPVAMSAKIQDFATTRSGQLLLGETWKSK